MRERSIVSGATTVMLILLLAANAALGQERNSQQMEQLLDQIDQSNSWPSANWQNKQTEPSPFVSPEISPNARPAPSFGNPPMQTPFNPQNILRVLLGAPPQGTASGGKTDMRASVEENLNRAQNEAARAEDACGRASNHGDKESCRAAAAEARYAAQAAREAADRATSQAYNASGEISDLAAQACDAADRAQGAADRATANAEGGGW